MIENTLGPCHVKESGRNYNFNYVYACTSFVIRKETNATERSQESGKTKS